MALQPLWFALPYEYITVYFLIDISQILSVYCISSVYEVCSVLVCFVLLAENKSSTIALGSNRIAERVHCAKHIVPYRMMKNIGININFGVKFLIAIQGNVNHVRNA